jgi:tetratricopeptide (TPR) repeat protein
MDRSSDRQKNSPTLENSVEAIYTLIPQISEERATAPERLSELLAASPLERKQLLASDPRFHTYSLAVQALRRAETAVFHRPAPAVELAQLARSIAVQVPPRLCGGTAALADLEAYTLAMEGNALRVSGDLQRALAIFAVARHVQRNGGSDPDLMARIDQLEASLYRDLRQLHTSLALLDRAAKAFRALKAHDELARTLINHSNVFLVQEDFGKAEELLERAIEFASDPTLQYTFKHNLIDILARSGRPREAARLLEETEDLYQEHPDPLTTIRRVWLEGVIARELRTDLEKAAELLTEVAARLSEQGYAMGAHFARIDLAIVFRIRQARGATPVR